MLAVLLSGCGGGTSPAQEFLTRGTSGTQEVSASRGIASGGTLFVSLEKELGMHCTVNWEVLGEEVTQAQVVMMLETFRMYTEAALAGLPTEEAGGAIWMILLRKLFKKRSNSWIVTKFQWKPRRLAMSGQRRPEKNLKFF